MSSSLVRAQDPPFATALEYLTQNVKALGLTKADLADLVVTDQYVSKHTGVTHIYLQQRHASIPVHNAIINVNITPDGQVLNAGSRFILRLSERANSSFPALTAVNAAEAAADHLGLTIAEPLTVLQITPGVLQETHLSTGGVALESIPVALVYHITQNGYTHTISTCCLSPIGGRQAFSGNSGGYLETVIDLSSFVGQTAQIRFRLATDFSVPDVGWYVDDVTITAEVFISNYQSWLSKKT